MMRLQVVTIAAGVVLAISGPSFAARQLRHAAKESRIVVTSPYESSRVRDRIGTSAYPFGTGVNFPYPDRPYGDPDHW